MKFYGNVYLKGYFKKNKIVSYLELFLFKYLEFFVCVYFDVFYGFLD